MRNLLVVFLISLASFLLYHFWQASNYDATPKTFISPNGEVIFHLDRSYEEVTAENHETHRSFGLWNLEAYLAPQYSPFFLVSPPQKVIAYTITLPFEGFQLDSIEDLVKDLQASSALKRTHFKVEGREMISHLQEKNEANAVTFKVCRYRLLPAGDGMIQACIGGYKKERELLEYLLERVEFQLKGEE